MAVGSRAFAEQVDGALGTRAQYRWIETWGAGVSVLRELNAPYSRHLTPKSTPISGLYA